MLEGRSRARRAGRCLVGETFELVAALGIVVVARQPGGRHTLLVETPCHDLGCMLDALELVFDVTPAPSLKAKSRNERITLIRAEMD